MLLPYNDQELVRLYETMLRLESLHEWYMPCFSARVALATGARVFELRCIQVQDVLLEYDPPVIHIRNGKGPRQNGAKGRERYVQVIPEFAQRLRDHVAPRALDWYLIHGETPTNPLAKITLQRWWIRVINFAGLRIVPIHQGARGTHATQEIERLPIHKLADRLGNGVKVLEKHYRRQIIGKDYDHRNPQWWEVAAR